MGFDDLRRRHQATADLEKQMREKAERAEAERTALRAKFAQALANVTPIVQTVAENARATLEQLYREPRLEYAGSETFPQDDTSPTLVILHFNSFKQKGYGQERAVCVCANKTKALLHVARPVSATQERIHVYKSFNVEQISADSFPNDIENALAEVIESLIRPDLPVVPPPPPDVSPPPPDEPA